MELTEREKRLVAELALCRKTVKHLTKEKEILMAELFTVDPNNRVLTSMQQ